jgi:hypothetical protein
MSASTMIRTSSLEVASVRARQLTRTAVLPYVRRATGLALAGQPAAARLTELFLLADSK